MSYVKKDMTQYVVNCEVCTTVRALCTSISRGGGGGGGGGHWQDYSHNAELVHHKKTPEKKNPLTGRTVNQVG